MSDILNINRGIRSDNSITKFEYHTYSPFLQSFNNNDEIRISIKHQDLCVLPSASFLYIEGRLLKEDGTPTQLAQITNNTFAYLFDSIRYELNGVEIDQSKNVGHTSTLKNIVSLNENLSRMLHNAAWFNTTNHVLTNGYFNFYVPLNMLLGFTEDYNHVVINVKHELILTRSRTDDNAVISAADNVKFNISKLQWRIPHITMSDESKLKMLKTIDGGRSLRMAFRSWDLYEYPLLSETTNHNWSVKTSNQLEKPRFIIFALQTDRKNQRAKDYAKFDHCNLTDVKLHLNSESFPYDDMNLRFAENRYALLYAMYSNFQKNYYGRDPQPLFTRAEFLTYAPIVVIDCSHQNEAIKTGPVDVKLEFKTSENMPPLTSAYCLILHDRIVEYNPLTSEVKKIV